MTNVLIPLPIDKQLYLSVSFANNIITHTHYCQSLPSSRQALPAELYSEDSSKKVDVAFAKKVQYELDCYFNQVDFSFSLGCELQQGTEFQQKVWQALCEIPSGEVKSYGALAKELNSSARAVGNACRRNHFPLIVPCHRVVSASGIGGYAGDTLDRQQGKINFLHIKQWLLDHEKATIK